MVRPALVARKARRAHEQQQQILRKQNLPSCEGCDLCAETEARAARSGNDVNLCTQSMRSKIRQTLKNKRFEGFISISPRDVALAEVANFNATQEELVYWVDGSCFTNSCGIGVAYCSPTKGWFELSWRVKKPTLSDVVEVYAIAKALELAHEYYCNAEAGQKPSGVCIYSDCIPALKHFARFQKSLAGLKKFPIGEQLVGPGIIAANELGALQVKVELRYVPGHAGIEGNVKADRAAKRGAKCPRKQLGQGRWIRFCMDPAEWCT